MLGYVANTHHDWSGIVARFDKLPEWRACECFGEGNGARTLADFEGRVRALCATNKRMGCCSGRTCTGCSTGGT